MNSNAIADLDNQIRQLERQLSGLYSKRVAALEAEVSRYRTQIDAFSGSVPRSPEAPAVKAPAALPVKKKGRPSRKQPVVKTAAPAPTKAEPKAKPVEEAPVAAPTKKKAAGRKSKQETKRTRTPTAVVEKRIVDALKEAGLFGLSQIEVSNKTGLGYQTVVKKLKELPGIEKKGSGKEGRYFVKA